MASDQEKDTLKVSKDVDKLDLNQSRTFRRFAIKARGAECICPASMNGDIHTPDCNAYRSSLPAPLASATAAPNAVANYIDKRYNIQSSAKPGNDSRTADSTAASTRGMALDDELVSPRTKTIRSFPGAETTIPELSLDNQKN